MPPVWAIVWATSPDLAAARPAVMAFDRYDSPAYQAIISLRVSSAKSTVFLAQGAV